MAPRIYTDRITVGGVTIYNVTADPNGALEAAEGSLAIRGDAGNAELYQNTDGATAWAVIGESSDVFVYHEGATTSGVIYGSASDLRTALNGTSGPRIVYVDPESPFNTWDAGTYGDDEVIIVSLNGDSSAANLRLQEGSVVPCKLFKGINISFQGSTPPLEAGPLVENRIRFVRCNINQGQASGPLIAIQAPYSSVALEMDGGQVSDILDSGYEVLELAGTQSLLLHLRNSARIRENVFGGAAGTTITPVIPTVDERAYISTDQPNFAGSYNVFIPEGYAINDVRIEPGDTLLVSTLGDLNLPSLLSYPPGTEVTCLNVSGGSIDVIPDGSDTIDGVNAAVTLATNYDALVLRAVETNIAGARSPQWVSVVTP